MLRTRVKKVSAPSKNPKKCPSICFAPDKKNNFPEFQKQRHIGIFMSQRVRERERGGRESKHNSRSESKSKSKSESKNESECGKGKEKGQ
jgi:hypothetical protein